MVGCTQESSVPEVQQAKEHRVDFEAIKASADFRVFLAYYGLKPLVDRV